MASKHEFFEGHASHLPVITLFSVHVQLALAPVIKSQSHLKHGNTFIVPHENRVLGQAECYRHLQIFGFQKNSETAIMVRNRKLIRGMIGPQGIASLNVLFNL